MIWTITKKEFLQKLLDLRVTVSFLIVVALTLVSCFVAGEHYQVQKAISDAAIAKAQSDLSNVKVYSQYTPDIVFPVSPLSVFSAGAGIPSPVVVKIQVDEVPQYRPIAATSNPLMNIFDTFDISTIIRVLFSLLVVLLTYDSFAGEKEDGTLRLAVSNSVSRLQLLIGKLSGTLLIVAAMVVMTFGIATLFLQTVASIYFSGADYARVFFAAIDSILYLWVFAVFGILVSIKFSSSSASLTTLLFVWLFVAILQPNLNKYLASEYTKIPRLSDIQPALSEASSSYEKKMEELKRSRGNVMRDADRRIGSMGGDILYTVLPDAHYDQLQYMIAQVRLYGNSMRSADDEWNLYRHLYLDKLDSQLHFERLLELFAPAGTFSHSVSILCGTDIDNLDRFMGQAREYRREYLRYLDEKGVFSNNAQLFFSRLTSNEINPDATARRFALYAKDPSEIPQPDKLPPLGLSDAPGFADRKFSLSSDLGRAALEAIPLVVFFLGLLVWAGEEMRKYQV